MGLLPRGLRDIKKRTSGATYVPSRLPSLSLSLSIFVFDLRNALHLPLCLGHINLSPPLLCCPIVYIPDPSPHLTAPITTTTITTIHTHAPTPSSSPFRSPSCRRVIPVMRFFCRVCLLESGSFLNRCLYIVYLRFFLRCNFFLQLVK